MDYQCGMVDIIKSIKGLIKSFRTARQNSYLCKVSTFQEGILPVMTIFPAIAVLPNNETFMDFISGGRYTIKRNLIIEGFVKSADIVSAQKRATEIGETVRDEFLKHTELKNIDLVNKPLAFSLGVGELTLAESTEAEDYVIGKFVLPVYMYSLDIIPYEKIISTNYKIISNEDFLAKFKDIIKNWHSKKFSKIRHGCIYFSKMPVLNASILPALLIEEMSSSLLSREAGRDTIVKKFRASVFTSAIPKPQLLWDNIEIIEGVKNTILINSQFDGYAKNTQIESIDFGLITVDGNNSKFNYFYTTSLIFNVECYRKVTFV